MRRTLDVPLEPLRRRARDSSGEPANERIVHAIRSPIDILAVPRVIDVDSRIGAEHVVKPLERSEGPRTLAGLHRRTVPRQLETVAL